MGSESFDQRMERACKDLEIPGAILVGGDKDGKFRYEKAFGQRSLKDPSKYDPMKIDDTMWIASCTKLITTIAAMQCVERGLLELDGDVTSILPELKGLEILTGFKEPSDEPILIKNTKVITLRLLLTHSSGLSYDFFNPILMRYRKWQNGSAPALGKLGLIVDSYVFPLVGVPGEVWEYSVGIDWAGLMVERVNNNISLDEYMQKNIWGPLGAKAFTFHPKEATHVLDKLIDMSVREGGVHPIFGITTNPEGKMGHMEGRVWGMDTPGCHGGGGGYTSPLEYQKVLQSICSDDGKLLKSSTLNEMFKPQLSDASRASLMFKLSIPELNQVYGGLPIGTKVDWGLGGMLIMQDIEGGRRSGTMVWGGQPNMIWFCDRVGGMSGIYGSQIQPTGDPKTIELYRMWEKELYKGAGKEKL